MKDKEIKKIGMCGSMTNGGHVWTYAGDPYYFPYEGMDCDCGMIQYGINDGYDLPRDYKNIKDLLNKEQ